MACPGETLGSPRPLLAIRPWFKLSFDRKLVIHFSCLRILVDTKILLGMGGVTIVIVSVTTSIGIYSYFGVPLTLIIIEVGKSEKSFRLNLKVVLFYYHGGLRHGRMARGGYGLPKVSPKPVMPFYALRAGHPCFRNGAPAGQAACCGLLSIWTPHAVRLWPQNKK
jgi:hypothetical protein